MQAIAGFRPGIVVGLTLALGTTALALGTTARAQDLNYQRLPIGDRPVGMGGAYTGLAEDASAAWYNPAGLAFLDGATFSGALSINIYDEYRVQGGFATATGAANLDDRGSLTLPLFVGGVAKVGSEPSTADRRHALAGALVNPSTPRRRYDVAIPADASGYAASLRMENVPENAYYGGSYAYRVMPELAVGVSLFVDYGKVRHFEDESLVARGTPRPDGLYDGSSLASRRSTGESTEWAVLLRLGALYQPMPELRIGLMIALPDIPVYRHSDVDEAFAGVDATTGTGMFGSSSQTELKGRLPTPFEARVGAAYRFRDTFRLSLDVSAYGPIASADDPFYVFGQPVPDPVSGLTPRPGRFFANAVYARPTANVAVGMETLLGGMIPLAVGFYTDFSGAPKIEGTTSPVYRPARINNYGFTLVTGYRAGAVNFSVGATFTMGFGHADAPDIANPAMFRASTATQSSLYIFFTGYAAAAEEIAHRIEGVLASEEELQRREREREERERLERLREECEQRLRDEMDANEGGAGPGTGGTGAGSGTGTGTGTGTGADTGTYELTPIPVDELTRPSLR